MLLHQPAAPFCGSCSVPCIHVRFSFWYPDRTFTRLQLLDEIWGMDSESDEKTVNVHINRLRNRFFDWPEFEIQTVRGLGYRAVRKAEDHAE